MSRRKQRRSGGDALIASVGFGLWLTRDLEFTVSVLQVGGAGSSNANGVLLLSCGVCRDAYARRSSADGQKFTRKSHSQE